MQIMGGKDNKLFYLENKELKPKEIKLPKLLINAFFVVFFIKDAQPPIFEHTRVQKVLINRRELSGQHFIQDLDDLFITLHKNITIDEL